MNIAEIQEAMSALEIELREKGFKTPTAVLRIRGHEDVSLTIFHGIYDRIWSWSGAPQSHEEGIAEARRWLKSQSNAEDRARAEALAALSEAARACGQIGALPDASVTALLEQIKAATSNQITGEVDG